MAAIRCGVAAAVTLMAWADGAAAQTPAPAAGTCGARPFQLFGIESAEELSRMMGAQARAARFLAGMDGEAGGSVRGKLFADFGVAFEKLGDAVPQAKAAADMWSKFSSAVGGSAEGLTHLLPGKMELVVSAEPSTFLEDDTRSGAWTVGATAASQTWNLTEALLQEALAFALDGVTLDPVLEDAGAAIDRSRLTPGQKRLLALAEEELADRAGGDALAEFSAAQLSAFLNAIGATEGPNGFFIAPQCWEVGGGWDAWAFAEVEGEAIELKGDRGFVPVAAGPAVLRIWTVEGRQAFGNMTRSARVDIEVRPIRVELMPEIKRVEPGERVPFLASVHDAVDPSMNWTASAGTLEPPEPAGEGAETSLLTLPRDPRQFPVEVIVRSTSTSGPRGRPGAPPRRARAVLELARPVIDIVPSSACVAPGDRRQFQAQVLGSGNQAVIWSGGGNSGRISPSGLFVAGTGEGTYTVRAAWEADRSVMSEIDVRVSPGDACLQVEYAGQLTGSWVFPKTHRTMLRVFTSTDLPAGACGIMLEMSSETEDYAILGGLLLGPLRAGSFPVRDARPQANADMQVDSVGLQVKPACARIEPECQHGLPRDASTGGRFQIDRITPRSAAGSFDIDVETEKRRYRVYGSFALPLGNVVGMRLADKHPCLPR